VIQTLRPATLPGAASFYPDLPDRIPTPEQRHDCDDKFHAKAQSRKERRLQGKTIFAFVFLASLRL
jgi:hypothetical protein